MLKVFRGALLFLMISHEKNEYELQTRLTLLITPNVRVLGGSKSVASYLARVYSLVETLKKTFSS